VLERLKQRRTRKGTREKRAREKRAREKRAREKESPRKENRAKCSRVTDAAGLRRRFRSVARRVGQCRQDNQATYGRGCHCRTQRARRRMGRCAVGASEGCPVKRRSLAALTSPGSGARSAARSQVAALAARRAFRWRRSWRCALAGIAASISARSQRRRFDLPTLQAGAALRNRPRRPATAKPSLSSDSGASDSSNPEGRSNDCLVGIPRTVERRDETVCASPPHPLRGSTLRGSSLRGSSLRGPSLRLLRRSTARAFFP
jgi:hypothetical protein